MNLDNVPAHTKAGLAKMNENSPLAKLTKDERKELALKTISRFMDGEKTADIAQEYGVTRQRLNQILLESAQEDWKAAQIALALTRKETAEEDLERAEDGLSLARARERVKSAQWDLERVFRRMYGDEKAQINIGGDGIQVQIVSYTDNNQGQPPAIDVTPSAK